MEGQLVVTQKDHPCRPSPEVMPAGSQVWEVPVSTSSPNQWGNDRWIIVRVRYHPECFEVRQG